MAVDGEDILNPGSALEHGRVNRLGAMVPPEADTAPHTRVVGQGGPEWDAGGTRTRACAATVSVPSVVDAGTRPCVT